MVTTGEGGEGPPPKSDFVRVFASSTVGNLVEWYDFSCYGALSDILGQKFFPSSSRAANLMESLAVFGGAFLMRPFGGAVFGQIADTVGRKVALEISIVLMVVPSVCLGLLPTYAKMGWTATGLLIALRLLQGLAVGGELVTAYVFVAEHAPRPETAPCWTGLVLDSANCGTLLGIVTVAAMRLALSDHAMNTYGWRLCFFFSLPLGIGGFMLRRTVGESKAFVKAEAQETTGRADDQSGSDRRPSTTTTNTRVSPLRRLYETHGRSVLTVAGVASLWCGGFYSCFVWMSFYYTGEASSGLRPVPYGSALNACMLVVLCVLFVPFAVGTSVDAPPLKPDSLENRGPPTTTPHRGEPKHPDCVFERDMALDAGARRALRRGQVGMAVVAVPAFALVGYAPADYVQVAAVGAQLAFAACLASFGAGLPFYLVHAFPIKIRVLGIGAAYNLSQAVFASAAPIAMTALLTKHRVLPGVALVFLAAVSYASLDFDTRRRRRVNARPVLSLHHCLAEGAVVPGGPFSPTESSSGSSSDGVRRDGPIGSIEADSVIELVEVGPPLRLSGAAGIVAGGSAFDSPLDLPDAFPPSPPGHDDTREETKLQHHPLASASAPAAVAASSRLPRASSRTAPAAEAVPRRLVQPPENDQPQAALC